MLLNLGMATSKELRIENLRALVREFKTADAVAQRAATAPMYLSQILNGAKSSTGKPRGVGDALARRLEQGCGKEMGWMDRPHGEPAAREDRQLAEQMSLSCETAEELRLLTAYRLADETARRTFDIVIDSVLSAAKDGERRRA